MVTATVRKWIYRRVVALGPLASVLIAAGCGDILGGSDLVLSVTVSDTLVGPDRPTRVTLTAVNDGDAVAWGQGSSSCQLTAVVRVDGKDYAISTRPCTGNLVLQGAAGGETLTEQFEWQGAYLVGDAVAQLPAGPYHLYALAGDLERSGSQPVRVAQYKADQAKGGGAVGEAGASATLPPPPLLPPLSVSHPALCNPHDAPSAPHTPSPVTIHA